MFLLKNTINKNIIKNIRSFSTNEKLLKNLTKSNSNLNLLETGIKTLASVILVPFGMATVEQNHIITYYIFGKYDGYRQSGLTWINPLSKCVKTYCGDITINHNDMYITDSSGNPIKISSFVTYNIINPINNNINLDSKDVFSNWIENITRQVISNYSYNELTNYKNKNIFVNDITEQINSDPNAELYGIEVKHAGILEINYKQEISETMLIKQKAQATIEARKELIDATINIIQDIGNKLDDKITPEDKSKLITYLTVSMISNNSPSHVINLN